VTGVFAEWQPRYAELGIPTFPVREKQPAVKGYLKAGPRASEQFAMKFAADDAFGLACRRNKITVLDVDAPDERLLADAMSEFGPTPFVVRSASGNFQAWYRHNGERRRVRPDPRRPIDILGDGFVVAPPSRAPKGAYAIICGTLADLAHLPTMRSAPQLAAANDAACPSIEVGRRNDALWRFCMSRAPYCSTISDLMEEAVRFNAAECYEPLPDAEVMRVVASAWAKEMSGENWFGRGDRVVFEAGQIDELLKNDSDAFLLLTILKRNHWRRDFFAANAMAAVMPDGGWRLKRFTAARRRLIDLDILEEVSPAGGPGRPAVYRFKGGRK
jgi:hypothetical protein